MMRAQRSPSQAGGCLVASLALTFALFAPPAVAKRSDPGDGDLSARLGALADSALRSSSPAKQEAALSLAPGVPGGLLRKAGRVLVEVRFARGAVASLGDVREAGAKVVDVSRRYQTVTVAAKPAQLRAIAAVRRVEWVSEVLAPLTRGADCGGSVRSEGDGQLNAGVARTAFALDGSGVTVGVLSDSFDRRVTAATHAAGDVASGDLPGPGSPCGSTTPVGVFDDSVPSGSDEGRAMAQIVHDLAPGANLSFATAFNGPVGFANNIRLLRAAGADVIVDDIFYPDEPFFQDGPIAVAVREVANDGAAYFSAAGNDNLVEEPSLNEIGSWEAPAFRDSGGCPPELEAIAGPTHCMDFDPDSVEVDDAFGLTVEKGRTLKLDLQWAEPWFGAETDLDVYLLDGSGKPIEIEVGSEKKLIGSGDDNIESGEPIEYFEWENETGADAEVQLAIDRCAGGCNPAASETAIPRLKFILLQNGGGVSAFEYPESTGEDVVGPTIFGHAASPAAAAVGAVRFNTTSEPEEFSSRGPLTHYFGPVTDDVPAEPIAPLAISKPDLAATDGGASTFFGPVVGGVHRFFGTSAAAPHAAGVAALMKQANPSISSPQLRATLTETARPVGPFGPDAIGAGLLDAYAAVSRIALGPAVSITERPPPLGRNPQPSIGFAANRPVIFSCSIDGGPLTPCSSPFVPPAPLADGDHGFAVQGIDAAGRAGVSETVGFRIDTRRPRTFIRRRPRKEIRTRKRTVKVAFRFASDESDVTFVCKIDGGFLRICKPTLVRRFPPGRHVVRVKARDAAGNIDRTPAVYRFRVKRIG
jgi:subtilisin family serine protease